jgi:hypothetical protein
MVVAENLIFLHEELPVSKPSEEAREMERFRTLLKSTSK